ncbi:hypothetical protein GCM10010431_78610 [Streptomyces kunmingensis]
MDAQLLGDLGDSGLPVPGETLQNAHGAVHGLDGSGGASGRFFRARRTRRIGCTGFDLRLLTGHGSTLTSWRPVAGAHLREPLDAAGSRLGFCCAVRSLVRYVKQHVTEESWIKSSKDQKLESSREQAINNQAINN